MPAQRPAPITIFGILNIVFAVLGVLGILASLALFAMPESPNNPVIRIMHQNPTYTAWIKLTIGIGLIACTVLLASGIGLLLLKPWARILSMAYAVYAILFGVLGTVVNYFLLIRPLLEEAAQKQGPESAGAFGGAVGGAVGGCFGLIYPILLLVFMTRPNVINALRPPVESTL